jgi:putative heme-binding domain-containing protein
MMFARRRQFWVFVVSFAAAVYALDRFSPSVRQSTVALAQNSRSAPDAEGTPANGARPPLPIGLKPLQLIPGERIAFVGNSLAERMNLFGHFEALLHSRFPQHQLVVRNFAWPCDAVDVRQRPGNYTVIDDPVKVFGADTYLCFFGFNESFAGPAGEEPFRDAYEKYLADMAKANPRGETGAPPRFVIFSPVAWEPTGNPLWPEATERNPSLKRYAEIAREVAEKHGLAFVDLYTPTESLFAAEPGMQFTINGCHLNETGDRELGMLLDRALFDSENKVDLASDAFQKLRAAVIEKSWVHQQDYRMLNGWYVYGGRRTWDKETFPKEYEKIRAMGAVRDRYIWDFVQGKSPAPPDDSGTGELYVPPTRFGNPRQDYSEPEELRYLSPEECIATMKMPEGFEVRPFASEREFPELAKPCQLNFDNRGRLWVACMPTYPLWKPGDPFPNDRLLILEDTNADGKADRSKVFYDKLHCPTGFEFWNGGVLVTDQPRLIWLKDTDGDDRADVVVHLFDGWASDDTHHAVGAFEFSHGGLLHMLEGVSMSTTVETPWGPHRTRDASGAHVLDPLTFKLRHFSTPGYGNPWCYVFNSWGQGFVGDGTGAQQHWDSPLSGARSPGRRGMDAVFDNEGMRPAVGSEFLLSRHLPDDVQGQFIYACVINLNGIPRFTVRDDRAGYSGERIARQFQDEQGNRQRVPDNLLESTDENFRPVDPQIGPDGAIWFGDWCNALIGHMQYSQRDPNRDHLRGRIYRLIHKDRPLLEPITQRDKSESELLEQFRVYEPRTRYRARRELAARPQQATLEAVQKWLSQLDAEDSEFDRLRCEALWVQQQHHAVDEQLLRSVLQAKTPDARAVAMHIVADERDYLPSAFELLRDGVRDEHPRVRLEAVRGLSFFPTLESADAAIVALDAQVDPWISYTVEHTIGSLEPAWRGAFEAGTLAKNHSRTAEFVASYIARRMPGLAAQHHLQVVLNPDSGATARQYAYQILEGLEGNRRNGRDVFRRVCAACHRARNMGYEFGPDLEDVGQRLTRRELIESIIEPSKKLDVKYITSSVITAEGKAIVGFVKEKSDKSITLLLQEGKTETLSLDDIEEIEEMKQSSMPENLASTLAPAEFLDVIEFLRSLRGPQRGRR